MLYSKGNNNHKCNKTKKTTQNRYTAVYIYSRQSSNSDDIYKFMSSIILFKISHKLPHSLTKKRTFPKFVVKSELYFSLCENFEQFVVHGLFSQNNIDKTKFSLKPNIVIWTKSILEGTTEKKPKKKLNTKNNQSSISIHFHQFLRIPIHPTHSGIYTFRLLFHFGFSFFFFFMIIISI